MHTSRLRVQLEGETVHQKRILIIENEPHYGEFLQRIISRTTPYESFLVTNGREVLEALSLFAPHLLLIEYRLPFINGLELCASLRTIPHFAHIPVIVMGAFNTTEETHFQNVTIAKKPLELRTLMEAIHKHLGKSIP